MTKLTNKIIDNLKHKPGNYIVWDNQIKGLGIRINSNGKKTFILKYRLGHGRKAKVRKPLIGIYNILRTEQARLIAMDWLLKASKGIDPCAQQKDSITLKEFSNQYIEQYAVNRKKKSSVREDRRLIRTRLIPNFGNIGVNELTKAHVIKYYHSISHTPIIANRFLALLSCMMNLAEKWGIRPMNTNPCKYVDRYPENKRDKYLTMEKLEKVGQAMRSLKDIESHYALFAIKLLMVTGCRSGEIINMQWEYIDFENNTINLPDSKTGPRAIHLSPSAIEILNSLPKQEGFVFRSSRQNKKLTTLRCVWKKICRIADLKDFRLHDLRHTYASFAVSGGFSLPIIAKMLGHADIKTTERYAHLHQDPVNKACDVVSLKIKKVMDMK
jgi:integrase